MHEPATHKSKVEPAAVAQPESFPNRQELTGTRLIHYGPAWDAGLESSRGTSADPVAILVCHGMGQQVRYETISQVAEAVRTEAKAQGGTVSPIEVHLSD